MRRRLCQHTRKVYILSGVGEFPLLDSVVCLHSVEAEVVKSRIVSFVLLVHMQCLDQDYNRCVNGVHLHKRGSITSRKSTPWRLFFTTNLSVGDDH